MWECPELFPLDGGHVLIYSTMGKVYWQSGVLDEATMLFHPKKNGLLDFDSFYAPKTQLDARRQRILWGWIQERRGEDAMRAAGWSGMMSLPRVLRLDRDGTLRMSIAEPMNVLRSRSLLGEAKTLPRATGELLCEGERGKSLDMRMARGEVELLQVHYAPETHSFHVGEKEIVLQPEDEPAIHAYVDGSVIEVILSSRIGVTKRFYYEDAVAPDISVQINGAPKRVDAWEIKPISPNRLATPA
jgi:beta-fructofuranosidase